MRRLWLAERIAGVGELSYIVVDELEAGVAVLVCEAWPTLDERSRLRFGDEEQRLSVPVDRAELQDLLLGRVAPVELTAEEREHFISRPLRVGDAFGAVVDDRALAAALDAAPRAWLRPPIVDVTAQAREAAKVAYYAAVGPVLEPEELVRIAAEYLGRERPA